MNPEKIYFEDHPACEGDRVRYVITNVNDQDMRELASPNQGSSHFDTREEAEAALKTIQENNDIKTLWDFYYRANVVAAMCYHHGDCKGTVFGFEYTGLKGKPRAYKCPLCENESKHSTNHIGEIYDHCKKCGSSVLYCIEAGAIAAAFDAPKITTRLHCYLCNIDTTTGQAKYDALTSRLVSEGRKFFNCYSDFKMWALSPHDGEEVTLRTDSNIKGDQWIANLGRLHNWFEAVSPNKKIKAGYYLEITEEMKELGAPR